MAWREGDHPYSGEPLTRGREASPRKEIPQVDRIVIASSSQRRQDLIRQAFGGVPIVTLPLGENEPDTTVTRKVVEYKLALARSIVREQKRSGQIGKNERVAIFAADTQSGPIRINRRGVPILEHRSKPKDTGDVVKIMGRMAQAADLGEEPHFTVTSSSGIYFDPNDKRHTDLLPVDPLMSVIYLDPDWLRKHSTEEGFRQYQAEFDAHHQSDSYTGGHDLHSLAPMTMTEAAAGLSIPVLTKMGAVTRIDEAERSEPEFPNAFRNAISVAAAGIDRNVLAAIDPAAAQRAQSWTFLDRMDAYALGQPQAQRAA